MFPLDIQFHFHVLEETQIAAQMWIFVISYQRNKTISTKRGILGFHTHIKIYWTRVGGVRFCRYGWTVPCLPPLCVCVCVRACVCVCVCDNQLQAYYFMEAAEFCLRRNLDQVHSQDLASLERMFSQPSIFTINKGVFLVITTRGFSRMSHLSGLCRSVLWYRWRCGQWRVYHGGISGPKNIGSYMQPIYVDKVKLCRAKQQT
jgi:hypothetical protein